MSSTPVVFSDQDIDQSGQSSKPITFGEDEIAKPSSGTALGDNPLGPGSVGYKAPAATRPQPRFTDVWYPRVSTEAQAGAARASSPRATASKAAGMPVADVAGAPHDPQLDVPTEYNPKTGMPFKPSLVPALDAPGFVPGANLERNVESAATELSRFRENDKPAYGVDPNNRFGPPVRILPEAEEEKQRRQRLDAAAGLVDNAMNVAGPVTAPMIAASGPLSVLKAGAGIAAGYGASEGGGALIHGKVSPEEEHAARTALFFLPSLAGTVAGLKSGTVETPQGKFSAASIFGGKAGAGVRTTPEGTFARVKVGGTTIEVPISRNGGAPAPAEAPAPAAPLPAGVTSMVKANAAEAMARNVVAGRPPVPPPPAPPPTPGEQFGNKLSGDQVDHLAKTIAEQPEEKRNGLIEEAHQNLTQWIADNKGKVIIDGTVHLAKTPDQAETLAAKLVNDAVAQHDKATAEAAKVQVKPESSQQPAKSSPEATNKPAAEVKQFLASSRPPKAATPVQELQAPTPKPVQASLGNEAAVVPPEPQTTQNLTANEGAKQEVAPSKLPDYITENRGRWFTPDEKMARGYARGGETYAVDVPSDVAKSTDETRVAGRPEHILPDAWKSKARPVGELGKTPDGMVRLFRGEAPHEVEPQQFGEKDIQPAHEYASTQVNIEPKSELGKRHAEAVAAIPDEHIGPNGKEETPHVTVRYGLKDDSPEAIEKIKAAAAKIAPFEATVGKTGSFPATKEGDRPIIAQVEKSPELNALRSAVEGAGEFKPDDHGEYKPHVTLGYVKPEHVAKYEGGNHLEGGKVPVDHIVVSKRDGTTESIPLAERRTNTTERKRVADMKPEEMARELHTSRLDNGDGTHTEMPIPNGRAFHDAPASPAVAMSDSDGLKAFNDKFGYKAGNAILVAKGEAAKEAGLDAYHQKGDEFLYHGESPEHLKAGLEKARAILRNREFTVTDATGKQVTLKGVDFSYGTGTDLATAESRLKAHKQQREASGERARGELRGITEVGHETATEGGSQEAASEVTPQTFHESDIEHELPEGVPAKGKSGEVPTGLLHFDPKRFQYKLNVNEKGVTNLLHGQKFNQDLAGVVSVWHDPEDGKLYVVNGHHRAQLAKETGQKELLVRHLDVATAGEARAVGALQNIAEGRGTAIDAAKFFRDRGISPEDLSKHGISLGEAKAADGLALSRLDQSIFERVATGKMSEGRGVAIGQSTSDPAQQEAIVKLLDKREKQGKNITDAMVAELARFVGSSGNKTIEQGGLFGANQQIHSLALEKAEISAHIKGQIAKERRVFGSVATEDKAAALGQVKGQKLKAEQNKKIADAAGQAEEAYNKLSSHAGPVNDILEKSAKELASGYHKPEDVKARAYRDVRDEIRKAVTGSEGQSAGRVQEHPEHGKEDAENADRQASVEPSPPPLKHEEVETSRPETGGASVSGPQPGSPEYESLRKQLAALENKPSSNTGNSARLLRAAADGLSRQIEEKRNPAISQQNVTARRARIADNMGKQADYLEKQQRILVALADAAEAGTLPESLQGIRTRAQLDTLMRNPQPPKAYIHNSLLRDLLEMTKNIPGTKGDRQALNRATYRSDGAVYLHGDEIAAAESLMKAAEKKGKSFGSWNYDFDSYKRAKAMGLDTPDKYAQAQSDLRDFDSEKPPADQRVAKIKKAERELIGMDIPGYFPTPKPIVEQMLDRADIKPGDKVLEPSAGKGNIADAIKEREPEAELSTIEQQSRLRDILELKGHNITDRDFLEHGGKYDKIVMNPPFENGQDMDHVRRAYDLLNPGGRVVAIMSEGPFFRSDKKATEFRDWLEQNGGESEKLPEGAFKNSERSTGVNTRMIWIDKPADRQASHSQPTHLEAMRRRTSNDEGPALPGMEPHLAAEKESIAAKQGEDLTREIAAPKESISAKAGEMERNSPLFRDTEASGQSGLFNRPSTPAKGDTVTLADGREGTVQYVHPEMNIARVKTGDGKTATVGLKSLKDRSGEAGFAKLDIPSAVADLVKAAHEKVFAPTENRIARGVDDTLYQLGKQYDADVLRTIKLLKSVGPTTSPEDQEAIYHHKEDSSVQLNQRQQGTLDNVVQPLMDTNSEMRANLNKAGIPMGTDDDGYIHRVVQGKNNPLERAMRGKGGTGKGNVLSKAASSLKGRRMFAAEDEDGKRVVIHRNGDTMTAFDNGSASEFAKDKPGLQVGDEFNSKDGQRWTLKQATTKEIEEHTGVRYYKNALANTVVDYLQLRRAERANDALEGMKADPEFKSLSFKPEHGEMPPDGWRTVNLPQFNGYYFEPHMAETLDRFADELRADPAGAMEKIGNLMTASLVLNPARHVYNIGNHWLVERGVTGNFNPLIWPRSAKAGIRAIKAVMTQNDDFVNALDHGAPMMSHRQDLRELHRHLVDSMLGFLQQHTDVAAKIAELGGHLNHVDMLKGLYKLGQKMTWMSNDMFFLQSIYEKELGGMKFDDAAAETAKHIPDYRIPSRVLNSPGLSKFMNSHLLTVFSRYHYGVWKSYGQMLKEVAGPESSLKDRGKGLDHMLMLGLLTFVGYELWDKLLKHVTGDPKARMVRSGASAVPYLVNEIAQGNKPPEELIQGTFTPAVLPKTAAELAFNRDLYSGSRIYDRHDPAATIAHDVGKKTLGALGPSQQVEKAERSDTPMRDFLAYQGGVTFPNTEVQSPAVRLMHEILRENMTLTPELQRQLDDKRARIQSGNLTQKERKTQLKKEALDELSYYLPHVARYSDVKKVFNAATPEEKEIIRPIMLKKAVNVMRNNPIEGQREGALQAFEER